MLFNLRFDKDIRFIEVECMKLLLGILFYMWKIYIGLVFLTTLLLFYPLLFFFLYFEKLKPYSFKINVLWSRCMRIFCFYAVEKNSFKPTPNTSYIIVANHTSYLDIFLLYSILPKTKFIFMGKRELLDYPLVKTFFKRLNIPVDRSSSRQSAKAFIKAKNEIKNGWSVVIFPEGGIIDPTSELHPFKNGAFQLAKAAQQPLLPITFINNYYLFSDPECFFYPAMPGLAKVVIHPAIEAKEVANSEIHALNEKAYAQINSVLKEID